ncbi:MAG: translation initiation factor IF-2 [Alphaproteobacteria bacterium]
MSDTDDKKPLTLSGRSKLEMKRPGTAAGQVRQSFSHGRSKTVTVEVKKKRGAAPARTKSFAEAAATETAQPAPVASPAPAQPSSAPADKGRVVLKALTDEEKAARAKALEGAKIASVEARKKAKEDAERRAGEEVQLEREREEAERREAEEAERKRVEELARKKAAEAAAVRLGEPETDEDASARAKPSARPEIKRPVAPRPRAGERRRGGKMTLTQALDDRERTRSLAAVRRQREREKRQARTGDSDAPKKVFREVVIPDTLTVQDLANRMTERGVDVIKALMKMGLMVAINETIDADTAELVVTEFGHRAKRVSKADVEIGFRAGDSEEDESLLVPRAPIVTVMGHVDHGKTSLLDALRATDVVAGEAGGITQHIGAYQVTLPSGAKITFLDTPGHEAFTSMRMRGATVTDIVVLVVAADDGIMPQTIEAINHAKAAKTPIIVAINKMDRPDADADRVRRDLLQQDLVVEELGGEVLAVEVSATKRTGLDKLEEAIVLQSEVLELKANPDRAAEGVVIEAKLDRGRGVVTTVLVQRGSLRVGDIVVAGAEWGKIRALVDDHGRQIDVLRPGEPAEVLGLNAAPEAGDEFGVVESEGRAREITGFRSGQARERGVALAATARGSVEDMFSKIGDTEKSMLPIIIKADVQGSLEAIRASLEKMSTNEVAVSVVHGGVGAINESDVTLAAASRALILGFNVRANVQARDRAKRDSLEIRYYSVIYNVVDDIKDLLSGMLKPAIKETMLGQARIKQVFAVSKVGKVAGCEVIEGVVRRGARARLLRDDVVVHEGVLAMLKHFKDDAREVRAGSECGIALENFHDYHEKDVIEAFEVEEIARTL